MHIGLDVGGTNIKGVLMDNNKKIITKFRIPTKSRTNKKNLLNQIFESIDLLKERTEKIRTIGIGFAGPIDFKKQKILIPPNVPAFKNTYLTKEIEKKFGIKTIMDNDANCFVLGETILGAGKGNNLVLGLTLGTGVGGGIVINKKVFHGTDGLAGEFGHITIIDGGRKCNCGQKGCLEPYINDTGIKKTAKEIFGKKMNSMRQFDDLAAAGDKRAIELYKTIGKYLGIGLANLVDTFNPDIIIIGGGIMRAGEFILEPAREEMKKNILSPLAKNTKVVVSKLGKHAGAIGAALLHY
jgi:glucokinase